MKKIFLIVLAVFSSIILIAAFKKDSAEPSEAQTTEQPAIKATTSEEKPILFIIKAYEGSIAVFKDGKDEPFRVLDEVVLKTLPEADRELLEKGIPIHSLDELLSLIEDYDS